MKFFKPILFCLLSVLLFCAAQAVLTPNWSHTDNIDRSIRGIKELDEDAIDVLFLGSSTTAMDVSPMKLYEDTGIRSYNLGTAAQPVVCSYYLLQYAFKYQSPSLVVYDPSTLYNGWGDDCFWRFVMDCMNPSPLKLKLAREYEEHVSDGSSVAAMFPLFRYHTRWNELTSEDFSYIRYGKYYACGQNIWSKTGGSTMAVKTVDDELNHLLSMTEGHVRYIENGVPNATNIAGPYYSPQMTGTEYLQMMADFCRAHGAELVFAKYPSYVLPCPTPNAWTRYKYEAVKALADQLGIPFLDMTYDAEVPVNTASEMVDAGSHMNARGAEKTTEVLEAYLLEHYDLNRQGSEEFDGYLADYQDVREVFCLQSERDFATYCGRLAENSDRWTVFIAAGDEYVTGLNDADRAALQNLGLQLATEGKYRDAYLAIVDRGGGMYEALSDRRLTYSTQLGEMKVNMVSSSWWTVSEASIKINYAEQAMRGRGLNFVVYDNATGLIIDNVCFDTFSEAKSVSRNWNLTYPEFRNYERAVCFD